MGVSLGQLFVDLLLNDEQFQSRLTADKKKLIEFGPTVDQIGDKLGGVLTAGFKAAAAAIAGFVAASAVVGTSFEAEMRKVAVVSGATDEQMQQLVKTARDLGASTQFSATEVAGGMRELAAAGLDTQQVMDATTGALFLAGAGATSLQTATGIVASTLASFSLAAADAGHVADVFAVAANKSQLTVDELGLALSYAGPVAKGFNFSLEDTVAALAAFRDIGLEGSKSGVVFRSVMTQATQDVDRTVEALERYGLTMEDINPETHSFEQILRAVGDAGVSTTDSLVIFGTEGGAAVKTLSDRLVQGKLDLAGLGEELTRSGGAAVDTYQRMNDTVAGSLSELQGAVEELMLSTFDLYKDDLRNLIDALAEVFNAVAGEAAGLARVTSGSLGDGLRTIADWLRTNKEEFARTFISTAQAVATLVQWMARVIPMLDEAAILVGTVFAAIKVTQFTAAITAMASTIGTATVSLQAMGAALVASTGGVAALTAGIAILVAGLAILVTRYRDAQQAADALAAAQRSIAAAEQRSTAAALEEAEARRANTLDTLFNLAEEEKARGGISEETQRQIDLFRSLTAEQAQAMFAAGELTPMMDEYRLVGDAVGGVAATTNDLTLAIGDQRTRIEEVEAQLQTWRDTVAEAGGDVTAFAEDTDGTVRPIAQFVEMIASGEAQLGTANTRLRTMSESLRAMSVRTADAGGSTRGLARDTSQLSDEEDKLANQREALARSVLAATREQTRAVEDALADEEQAYALAYDRERDDVQRKYDEFTAEAHKLGVDTVAIESERTAALQAIDDRYYAEGLARQQRANQARIDDDARRAAEQLDLQQRANDAEAARQDATAAVIVGIERGRESEVERLRREHAETLVEISGTATDDEIAEVDRYYNALTNAARLDSVVSFFTDVADAIGVATSALQQFLGFGLDVRGVVSDVLGSRAEAGGMTPAMAARGGLGKEAITAARTGQATARAAVEQQIQESVRFVRALAQMMPEILRALIAGIPDLVNALLKSLPRILMTLARMLPDLITAIVLQLPRLINAVLRAVPNVIEAFVDGLPRLFHAIFRSIPDIITVLIRHLPRIVIEVIAAIPEIAVALVESLITELIPRLPFIVAEFFAAFIAGMGRAVRRIADAIGDAIADVINVFSKDKRRDRGDKGRGYFERLGDTLNPFNDRGQRAYSGIEYVPAPMRVSLEPGEAVLTAERNAQRLRGPQPAVPGAMPSRVAAFAEGGTASGRPVQVVNMIDGHVIGGAIVDSVDGGRAPRLQRMLQRGRGTRVGFSRGRFDAWGN